MLTCIMKTDAYRNSPLHAGNPCSGVYFYGIPMYPTVSHCIPLYPAVSPISRCIPLHPAISPHIGGPDIMKNILRSTGLGRIARRSNTRLSTSKHARSTADTLLILDWKICVAFPRMYEITHADMSRKQMDTGTVHRVLGRIAHGPNMSSPRAASARSRPCRCSPLRRPPTLGRCGTSRPSCARSEPSRGSRKRALRPRERQASEWTESGVPSTDPTAIGPGARGTCARRRARAPVERALHACVTVTEADDEPS
jgi:hypothetical protein